MTTATRTLEAGGGRTWQYELGTLLVPENRDVADSRLIGVGFAHFRSTSEQPAAPPMFRLPGGPGGSYVSRLEPGSRGRDGLCAELEQFLPWCDVVFVDQRGFSEQGDILRAVFQVPPRDPQRPMTTADWVAASEACARAAVAEFEDSEVDLRGYHVKECAHDVAALARALDYESIILNGTSFGSQWSFAVMRLHPDLVARALLSGVEPLDHGYDMPSHVFAAVQRMWQEIDADPRFAPHLPEGGMAEAARVAIERLEREPLRIEVERTDGTTKTLGVFGPAAFPWNDPDEILDLFHGRTERWKRQAMRERVARGQRIPLIGPSIDTSLGVTPARRYRLWNDPATRYLGRNNFAGGLATAAIWPSPDVGDDFRTPELCDIPVVFAQGDWDTKTPIENTYEIAPFFPRSRVVIAERGGHGVLGSIAEQCPEAWAELLEFVQTGDLDGIPARVRLAPSRTFTPPS
ncbi:MAG: alpha/beta hydrolase [Planctomycetota bacterium]